MSNDPGESVSAVNQAFYHGLKDRYSIRGLNADRSVGTARQSRMNFINGYYFAEQFVKWTADLLFRKPAIAHYAISTGWAMEKGLIFMKLARWSGAKTLGHLHAGEFLDFWRDLSPSRRNRALAELRRLDGFVVLSDQWKHNIVEHVGLDPAKVHVVNNPINPEFEAAALQMPVERPENRIVALGIMNQNKGVLDLLEACRIVSSRADFHLQIAGPEREPGIVRKCEKFIQDNSLQSKIALSSGVWGKDKIELYRKSPILVLPSYFENFPLVVLEAAAAGMAIVTTPVGAVPEFFEDGVSALFIPPRQPAQLADALTRLLQNPAERGRLGEAARRVFLTRLSRSKIMDSLDAVYRSILS